MRSAYSLAGIAEKVFGTLHGVKELRVHLVRCRAKKHINTYQQLESSLIRAFEDMYGYLPYFNGNHGARLTAKKQFTDSRLNNLLQELS